MKKMSTESINDLKKKQTHHMSLPENVRVKIAFAQTVRMEQVPTLHHHL